MTQAKETKSFPALSVKILDPEQGIVEHVVAVMGNIDRGNDIIHNGAFSKTLQERGGKVKVLDGHDASSVLRVVGRPLELHEVDKAGLPPDLAAKYPEATGALVATTQFLLDTPEGRGVYDRIKAGAVDEYSIGYDPILADYATVETPEGKKTIRNLRELRLYEYSPVVFAMNPATQTLSAKDAAAVESKVKPGDDETEDEFMARCVPAMIDEGREQDQAVAMCISMFAEGTKDDDEEKRKRRRRKIPSIGGGPFPNDTSPFVALDPPKAGEATIGQKAANVADWVESGIHQQFTIFADDMFMNGLLTREERIGLSGLIGDALDVFHQGLQGELFADMRTRRPGTETKAGRRVRKEKLDAARQAVTVLADFLKWADYDESEPSDEDDEEKPKAAAGPDLHPRQKQAMLERLRIELTEV